MKEFEKHYDKLENLNANDLNNKDMKELENELGNLNDFVALDSMIQDELSAEEFKPSEKVKSKLDQAFERRYSNESKRSGIISINAFERSKPWKMMATAASMTIVLFLSVQMGLNRNNQGISSPYLADSNLSTPIDSGAVLVDSVMLID